VSGSSVLSLPIADIAVGPRVGFFRPEHAASLGRQDMAEFGQSDPIHVRRNGNRALRPWTLVAGLHRLRGAERVGWSEISALQVADASCDNAALLRLELSENLDHRMLRPIERSCFIAARARLEGAPEAPLSLGDVRRQAARVRWDKRTEEPAANTALSDASITVTDALGWRERTAAALGCSIPTLERYQAIYLGIVQTAPDLAEQLDAHPLAGSLTGLLRVARLADPSGRRHVIETILADPELASIDAAIVAAGFGKSHAETFEPIEQNRFEKNLWSNFDRLDLRRKRSFVSLLPARLTPGLRAELVRLCQEIDG
jgi:ParB family chromosome partitioning protein